MYSTNKSKIENVQWNLKKQENYIYRRIGHKYNELFNTALNITITHSIITNTTSIIPNNASGYAYIYFKCEIISKYETLDPRFHYSARWCGNLTELLQTKNKIGGKAWEEAGSNKGQKRTQGSGHLAFTSLYGYVICL